MPRQRILFIAEAVTLAHVARANVLARTLDASRYEIHVAWDSRYNSVLGELPFTFHQISSLSSAEFLRRLSRGTPMHDADTLRGYVEQDLDIIARVKPSLVIGDFRLSLAASARLAGVPHVAVGNAYWSPYGQQTFLFPEYDYPLANVLGSATARALFRLLRPIGFAAHTRPLNTVLREHGLPGIGGDIRTMYTFGDVSAYADIPALVPIADLPSTHRYVGAVLWSPATPLPSWWTSLPQSRPIVYVTPGSSGDEDFLAVVLDALADLPVTTVAATAGRVRLPRVPANAHVAEFLPGVDVAARSRLVVCNGGSPTTNQALAAGVPVLGIPSNNMDQHLNMEAVRRYGAGDVLRARGLTQVAVRETVERLLGTHSYTAAATQLQSAHAACDPARTFRALVEDLIGR